jgi:myosin heavy subunit
MEKLKKAFSNYSSLIVNPIMKKKFILKHFVEDVVYDITGFLEKNKDTFYPDLEALCVKSKQNFVRMLFSEDLSQILSPSSSGPFLQSNKFPVLIQFDIRSLLICFLRHN